MKMEKRAVIWFSRNSTTENKYEVQANRKLHTADSFSL